VKDSPDAEQAIDERLEQPGLHASRQRSQRSEFWGMAKSIFDDLYNKYDDQKQFFSAELISKQSLKNVDTESYYKRMAYLRAKWDLSCGRFEEAMKVFEELITAGENDPSLLKRLKLTLEGVRSDVALVKTKLGPR